MTVHTCTHCDDSGKTHGSSDLDCTHCSAARERSQLNLWLQTQCRHMLTEDRVWAIYQRGKAAQPEAKAAPAVAALSDEQIDRHIDEILLCAGTAMRHYSMQKSKDDMRAAMRVALAAAGNSQGQAAQPEQKPTAEDYSDMLRSFCCRYAAGGWNSEGLLDPDIALGKLEWIVDEVAKHAAPVPAAAPELATVLRGIHGWAIEMLDMAEFKAWPDADRADFMLKMRAAEELLKNYPRKA